MYSTFFQLFEAPSGGFNLGNALDDCEDVISSIVEIVQGNIIIAAAFALGVLIPVGAKAFKRISRIK